MNMKNHILTLFSLLAVSTATVAQNNNYQEYEVVIDEYGNREEIDVPTAMTFNVDSMLETYHARNYLHEVDGCNMKNTDPEYDREVYVERLRRLPTVMEMPYNEVVRKFIDRYTKRGRRQMSFLLGAANFYTPIFEEALETYGLPLELKYLPVIESGLNPNAVSPAGASGLWQFMLSAGKQYGLEVNSLVDERRDPLKASDAAARLLRDLYRVFGDWNLVIAAYNCGPERIKKAIHRAGGETDYWKIYPYLPRETRGYVPSFIAANYVMNYYCDHNICPMETDLPQRSDTVHVRKDVHFDQIARVIGIESSQLRELNPQYRRNIVNGSSGHAALRLPSAYIGKFIDAEDSIYNTYHSNRLLAKRSEVEVEDQAPRQSERSYSPPTPRYSNSSAHSKPAAPNISQPAHQPLPQVKSRSRYSERHSRNSYQETVNENRGKHKGKGKRADNYSQPDKKGKSKKAEAPSNVTVEKGQTLSQLAAKHHTTVDKLKKINKLTGDNIRAGKQIKVK